MCSRIPPFKQPVFDLRKTNMILLYMDPVIFGVTMYIEAKAYVKGSRLFGIRSTSNTHPHDVFRIHR